MTAAAGRPGPGARPRRPDALALQHREVRPVAVAAGLLLAVVVADVLSGDEAVFISLLITAPLLAAAFTRPGVTAVVGATAVALAVVLAPPAAITAPNSLIRVAAIAAGSILAVFVAARREQRETALLEMTQVADVAQNAVLWPVPRETADLALAARYLSATHAARIGGDLYEVVETEHGTRLLIGDVRGKGLEAVRLASAVLGCFREVAHTRPDLSAVHEALEATVRRVAAPEDFVTAVLVEVAPDQACLLSCGHPPPLLLSGGSLESVPVTDPGLPLGLGDGPLEQEPMELPVGVRLLLHTDGLLEARPPGGAFFPVEEQGDVLSAPALDDALDGLLDRLRAHCGGGIGDDVALLLVQRRG